jgi:hypothetical protein
MNKKNRLIGIEALLVVLLSGALLLRAPRAYAADPCAGITAEQVWNAIGGPGDPEGVRQMLTDLGLAAEVQAWLGSAYLDDYGRCLVYEYLTCAEALPALDWAALKPLIRDIAAPQKDYTMMYWAHVWGIDPSIEQNRFRIYSGWFSKYSTSQAPRERCLTDPAPAVGAPPVPTATPAPTSTPIPSLREKCQQCSKLRCPAVKGR